MYYMRPICSRSYLVLYKILSQPAAPWPTAYYCDISKKPQGIITTFTTIIVVWVDVIFNPLCSAVEALLPTYLSCLKSHEHSVVMATVGVVPELVLLCPSREASRLLQRLFRLSGHSFMDCTPQLLQAVEACTRHVFQ